MVYILILLIIIISFAIITFSKKRRYKKLKLLSKMNKKEFKQAMKDLEIK